MAVGATVPVAVKVATPAGGSVTVVAMLPAPAGAAQLAPPWTPTQVQLTPVIAAGNVSATATPDRVLGPGLLTTMV